LRQPSPRTISGEKFPYLNSIHSKTFGVFKAENGVLTQFSQDEVIKIEVIS